MPATLIDSAIFGDIFSTDPMRRVWSDENRTQKSLDVEAALARVQAHLGIVPQEAAEPFAQGRGSSSTMPQKRNPISCCYIHAAISVVRQYAAALLDAMVAEHERSTGPWEIEW